MNEKYISKVRPKHYLAVFQLARQGMSKTSMAEHLKITKRSLNHWLANDPEIKSAFLAGREEHKGSNFMDYAYRRLPPNLQRLWDEITQLHEVEPDRLPYLLEDRHLKKFERQHLFVHAFLTCNFNMAEACRRTNTTRRQYEQWCDDPKFRQLLKQLHDLKKDFCESALMGLVSQGDSAAVIFANKTLNADRGYNPRKQIEVTGSIDHKQIGVDQILDMLDLKDRKRILAKLKEAREGKPALPALPAHVDEDEGLLIQDAEYTVKKEESCEDQGQA